MKPQFITEAHPQAESLTNEYIMTRGALSSFAHWTNDDLVKSFKVDGHFWVGAIVDQKLVAIILFTRTSSQAEVLYLETQFNWRRRGLMVRLMKWWFEESPDLEIFLDVHSRNFHAIGLYQQLGFEQSGMRKSYYRDGGDCLLMTRPGLKTRNS